MIETAFPWALLALPVPLVVWWMVPRAPQGGGAALRVPFLTMINRLPAAPSAAPGRSFAVVAAKTAIWLLLIAAAAQPRWVGEPRPVASNGRDLMLALDLSASMAAPDYSVNGRRVDRHTIVNAVAKDFVGRREGDRVGLILFGSRAYLQSPLTLDRDSIVEACGKVLSETAFEDLRVSEETLRRLSGEGSPRRDWRELWPDAE